MYYDSDGVADVDRPILEKEIIYTMQIILLWVKYSIVIMKMQEKSFGDSC